MILLALALAAAQPSTCKVVAVHDGDTLTCADGRHIRLQGIDANEMDGSCHNYCAILTARDARENLERLALGKTATVQPTGKSYNRITAWLSVGGLDLSCEQLRIGAAVRWERYDRGGRLLGCFPGKGAK